MSIATQITRINTAKADIKEVVNQDFEKIQDETITYYPDKIAETIEEYKKYIPEKSYSGTEVNVDDAVPLRVPMIPKGNTYQATSILPEGYTQVDYIESHGNEYINTGVNPTFNTEVELEFMSTNVTGSGFIYGSRISNNNNSHTFILFPNSKDYYPQFANDGTVVHMADTHPELAEYNTRYKVKNGKDGFYVNDVLVKQYSQTQLESSYPMYIFGLNVAGNLESRTARARIYKFKIYENDILIRDYVPCYRNSDNEVGLYDIVNNVFYTKQGTGAFTYGATVTVPNPDFEIPIEVVTGNNVIKHVGQQLFNKDNYNIKSLNASNQNAGSYSSASNQKHIYIKCKPDTDYIVHKDVSVHSFFAIFETADIPAVGVGYKTLFYSSSSSGKAHVTTSSNAKYLDVRINTNAISQNEIDEIVSTLFIAEGTEVNTPYESYKESLYQLNLGDLELCKIGDYEDVLFKNVVGDENYNAELESGTWYKKNAIGIYEFTGNEPYQKSSTYSDSQYFCAYTKNNILTNILINGSMYCTRFGTIGYYTEILDKECIRCAGQAHIRILASRLKEASEQALKDLLKQWYDEGNPMKAYYSLNTPTYTKITDPTLISQLEALNKFKWFKGVNHIWTETENLEPVLEGKYKAVVESEVS